VEMPSPRPDTLLLRAPTAESRHYERRVGEQGHIIFTGAEVASAINEHYVRLPGRAQATLSPCLVSGWDEAALVARLRRDVISFYSTETLPTGVYLIYR